MTTNAAPSLSELLQHIAAGAYDGEQSGRAIVSAINARSRAISAAVGAAVVAALKPGDRVRITGDCRPAHMIGQEGIVTAFNRTKVSVRLDGGIVDTRIPPVLLEKLADAVAETATEATERLVKEFEAKHAEYPQYADHTKGAVAVPLRKNWKHRGANFPKGTFVLLLQTEDRTDGYVSIWHSNLLMTTLTDATSVVIPKGR